MNSRALRVWYITFFNLHAVGTRTRTRGEVGRKGGDMRHDVT